jgi:hypothetical protein
MKKSSLTITTLLTSALLSVGCSKSTDVDDILAKSKADTDKQLQQLQEYGKTLENGGQPGSLVVRGIVVKDDSEVDNRIKVTMQAGLNRDKTRAELKSSSKPILQSSTEKIDLAKMTERNNLVSIGCDQAEVDSIAKERNLDVKALDAPISIQTMVQYSKVLMLCGNVTQLSQQYIIMSSDEIILNNASINILGTLGGLTLSANKLVLKGKSIIDVKSIDNVSIFTFAPDLELNVVKEIEAEQDATLELKSTGADNKAPAK